MQATPTSTAAFALSSAREKPSTDWLSALPDALAFAIGLGVARWAGWTSGDLIWSLWLSSLVVGYATIVWTIVPIAVALIGMGWRIRNDPIGGLSKTLALCAIVLVGASFYLAFFTVHFGGFHYVHSQILLHFFPIGGPGVVRPGWGEKAEYLEIVRRYWIFLPSAFLSHRAIFLRTPITLDPERLFRSFLGGDRKPGAAFGEPYKNVLRMHGLIFFFFFAHFAGLENFAFYTVIYAVYFFPWRLVRSEA
jgi:hypothetical protein